MSHPMEIVRREERSSFPASFLNIWKSSKLKSRQGFTLTLPRSGSAGCLVQHKWSSPRSLDACPVAVCVCFPLAEPPRHETPRPPAPSKEAPPWRCRAGWSSASLYLHSVQTQAPVSLCQPRCWWGPNPSFSCWNISNHKNISVSYWPQRRTTISTWCTRQQPTVGRTRH